MEIKYYFSNFVRWNSAKKTHVGIQNDGTKNLGKILPQRGISLFPREASL